MITALKSAPEQRDRRGRRSLARRRARIEVESLDRLILLSTINQSALLGPLPLPVANSVQGLPSFNPALGTLTSVQIFATGSITSDIKAENLDASQPATISDVVAGTVTIAGPGFSLATSPTQTFGPTTVTKTVAPPFGFTGTDAVDFGSQTATSPVATTTITDPTLLASFISSTGAPVSGVTLNAQATSHAQSTSNLLQTGLGSVGQANVVLVYTYTAAPQAGSLSGFVFDDSADNNGLKESGEPGIGGVTVALTGTTTQGQPVSAVSTTTNPDGSYSFSNLQPGTYIVTQTSQPQGTIAGKDSLNGSVISTPTTPPAITGIVVNAGADSPNNDFGEIRVAGPGSGDTGSLTGTVFNDTSDDNGLQEPGEAGLPNVSVTLTGVDTSGIPILFQLAGSQTTQTSWTLTTDTNGNYNFNGLPAGTYTVTEGASPSGFHHGKVSENGVVLNPATTFGKGVISNVALANAASAPGNDFAELQGGGGETAGGGPLLVTAVDRFGAHNEPTEVVITFNEPLDPVAAQNVGNYELIDTRNGVPVGNPVPLRAAVYDPTSNTVTLIPTTTINVHHQFRLTVSGNLVDETGLNQLEGNGSTPGTNFVSTVNFSSLSGFLDNQGNFVAVNHGQFTPGTYRLLPAPGHASQAALAGYPVPISSLGSSGSVSSSQRHGVKTAVKPVHTSALPKLSTKAVDSVLAGHSHH